MDPLPSPPTSAAPAAPATTAPPAPLRTFFSLLLPLLGIVLLLALVLGGIGGGLRWLFVTEPGSAWLLRQLPMVQLKGFRGALIGDRWVADSLRVQWDGGRQWLLIEDLNAQGLRWQWRPNPEAWLGVQAQSLAARKLTLHTGPPAAGTPKLPADLAPPVLLSLGEVSLAELVINDQAPLLRLSARQLQLDPRRGERHRLEQFGFQGFGVIVQGDASLGPLAPYPLQAQASVRPALDGEQPRWAAMLRASGTLAAVEFAATLRGRPLPGREAPALDLRAGLRPFEPWALASLSAETRALDLSALSAQAPQTRLSGQAVLQGGANQTPLSAQVDIVNASPGRWNERRLPVQKLAFELNGELARPERLQLSRFELALADATRSAGRVSGSAVWLGHELTLKAELTAMTPQRLDGRAAAMTLAGPLAATLRGLPSPDFRTTSTPPAPGVQWKVDLQGQLDAAPQPVRLTMEGSADDQRLELKQARAESGRASADFSATLARRGSGSREDWLLSTSGSLRDFDPLPWWPGEASSAWRKGPHRLSGDWKLEARLPGDADKLPPLALAQRVAGNGTLRIADSQIAGVPLAADITLGYTQAAAPAAGSLRAEFTLGGNQLRIDGRGDPAGAGGSDRWRIELQADALTALAPLARLDADLAGWVPRQGSASARLAADGRWPAMRVEGDARLSQLAMGPLALARGSVTFGAATTGEQPLALQLDLAGIAWGAQRADHLRASLRGTAAEHRIDISGAMPVLPPPVAEQMLGIQAQSGTRAQMQASGRWLPASGGGGKWKANIERLIVGSWDGSSASAPPASGWAETRDLRAELDFGPGGELLALQADPGRLRLAETLALRWDAVRIDLRGTQPQWLLHADIDPFPLAPLLARAQPGVGWSGDLKLSARVDIRAAEKMEAELVFERTEGDLHVTGSDATQLLGLSELRLNVTAKDGIWNFTPLFRGRSLGEISGQVRVVSTPERRWPLPQSPLQGELTARVADIGIWSAWVPPGWRLVGELRSTAMLAGTFGQPQFNGELSGNGIGVRNLLEGVNVSDGQIVVKLAGDTAQIERFTLRGGDGTASVTGSATLGSQPQARLQLKADRFRLLGRVDRQVITSGQAELQLNAEQTRVEGRFAVDEALFDTTRSDAPSLDEDVTVRRAGAPAERADDPAAPRTRRNLVLGIDIDLGNKVRVRGRGLETELRGQLRITNPGGRLALNGTVSTERGTYAAYGQKLDIERGIVAFSGAADNPRLDVLALRQNIDTRVGVQITGGLQSPRVRLYSEPEMSDADKLSWLVLGRASDGLGRNDTAMLQRAAVALLAGEGEAPTDGVLKALGIDEVGLRQSDGEVRETVITIGKQLSRRWYLGYERGVNATTGTWQLIYRIAQRFTLRLQSGQENAADVIWTWRFQETPKEAGAKKQTLVPR